MKIIRTATISLSLNVLLKGQLKYLSKTFEVIGLSSNGTDLENVRTREGVRTIAIDMERGITPIKDFISLVRLYKIFRKEQPIIVHSITPKAGFLSMLAAKFSGVPIRIHTFTGLIFPSKTGLIQKILIVMDKILCWAATNIYPEGNGVKNDLINYNITSKPLKVLANGNVNGIDTSFFSNIRVSINLQQEFKKELKIGKDDFIFIFIGRLVGNKGINELVEAFSKIEEPRAKLILVGPTESELDPLKPETLVQMKSNPRILVVGFQEDVRPYLAISDALVFPSYREGFPNVVMQAGAMGLPSIVTDINGCNEIIIHKENGLIIPTKNVNALLESMQLILNDKQLFKHLKSNARAQITTRFEQKHVWEALLEEYQLLLEEINV